MVVTQDAWNRSVTGFSCSSIFKPFSLWLGISNLRPTMSQVLCCLSLPLVQLCVVVAAQVGGISMSEGNMFHSVPGLLIGSQEVLKALISFYIFVHLHIYMTEHFPFWPRKSFSVTVLPVHVSFPSVASILQVYLGHGAWDAANLTFQDRRMIFASDDFPSDFP